MELNLVPISKTKPKQDPAWNYCLVFKNEDNNSSRLQMKCMYCGKMFRGGGIHRFKEHLAGRKGQGPICEHVPPAVRALMQESLNGISVKQVNRQKTIPELLACGTSNTPNVGKLEKSASRNDDVSNGIKPVLVLNPLEPDSNSLVLNEQGEGSQGSRAASRKRRRGRSLLGNIDSCAKTELALVSKGEEKENPVHLAIGRFLYDIGVDLDAVNSVYFQPMIDAIAAGGSGITPPSSQDIWGWISKKVIKEVKDDIDGYRAMWRKTGCSILVDQWSLKNGRTLLSFLVYCPQATVFLKSTDASHVIYSVDHMYELIKQVVEEVGVENVVQVITNCEEQYTFTGKRLMASFPSLYWAPCLAHCVNMMLQDFGNLEWINKTIEQAKSVTRFIYNHDLVLNMMRRFTFGNDIVEPAVTFFATNFATLKRMADHKLNLQAMVNSEDWLECRFAKKPGGQAILDIVRNRSFWNSCILIVRLTYPLLRVLEIAGSKKRSAMGYVYAGIYRAKETIKKELVKKDDYMIYWNIIDRRWEQQQHLPLYAASFFLNPKFFFSTDGNIHHDILSSVFDCIERLVPDTNIQDKIVREIHIYKDATGDLGRPIAVRARDNLPPGEWWSTYGGSCPNLQHLAIRILSQTCCSIGCKPNKIYIEEMHDARNFLQRQRLGDIFFLQYNLYLRRMVLRDQEKDFVDPLSFNGKDNLEDWIADSGLCIEDYGTSDWTSLDPPTAKRMPLESSSDATEDLLGTRFGDLDIFNGLKGRSIFEDNTLVQ